jgi:hypothetical protein
MPSTSEGFTAANIKLSLLTMQPDVLENGPNLTTVKKNHRKGHFQFSARAYVEARMDSEPIETF